MHGNCIGWGLLKIPEIAVQKSFLSGGTKFKAHKHMQVEYLIVYKGELTIKTDNIISYLKIDQ